ncbi:zona pellucida sperm-binding protein 4-like isoform X1 [Takifugu flavidus]|uniref:zona pellucida sperm-binding protein 4-like isoform X1 n=2 Tax=Takifugu flavidus TaxID=433684 RepID=UPI0025445365|nr:zona pellucida sperm-binding protein 4-like isoform X1 [Takifugu flavidus]
MNCCLNLVLISFHLFFLAQLRWRLVRAEQLALPRVICSVRRMRAAFGPMVKSNIHVKDKSGARIPVPLSEGPCGVRLGREKNISISFFSRYDSCYAHIENHDVVVLLEVQLRGEDEWLGVRISCPLIQTSDGTPLIPASLPGKCEIDRSLRVDCGQPSISPQECVNLGCCYDEQDSMCFYRLNACSLDGHFVFSVKATETEVPIDPSALLVKGHPHCLPVVITPDTAVFKIGLKDCGSKMKVEGDMVIYEVELEERYTKTLTNTSPFSLQVQCEYEASDLMPAANLRSLYSVTNRPPVVALGSFRVLMRIAKDSTFTSFLPEDQLPLSLPLRKAAYVEVTIAQPSPDPTLSLRVRDCFAYPVSRHSVWTLLYDGCPNPLDDMRSSVPVDNHGKTTSHSQVRRFDVKTFAFVDPHTGHPSMEEIYFYCWVEICTNDAACAQQCTLISAKSDRQKREAASGSNSLELVSLGPLLLTSDAELEDTPCMKLTALFQVVLYMLSAVGAVVLFILLLTAWSSIGKKQESQSS